MRKPRKGRGAAPSPERDSDVEGVQTDRGPDGIPASGERGFGKREPRRARDGRRSKAAGAGS
jgi:hypothetical protein